ncbi:MAG: hypothetical protein ABIL01_30545 [Pseudomonadota bacterium]
MPGFVKLVIVVLMMGAVLQVYRSANRERLSRIGTQNAMEARRGGPANHGKAGIRRPEPKVRQRP